VDARGRRVCARGRRAERPVGQPAGHVDQRRL